jgi:uncharacterized protein YjbJ (UPF0337 family)
MSAPSTTERSTENPSKVTGLKDQTLGAIKQTVGNVLHKEKMEVEGKIQKEHGKAEYELAKTSNQEEHDNSQTIKQQSFPDPVQPEPIASSAAHQGPVAPGQQPPPPANNNLYPTAGLPYPAGGSPAPTNPQGAGQPNPHNDQQAPPPYFGQQTPAGPAPDEPSKMSAKKDQAVGSVKENVGSATNKPEMELAGKEQKIHGQNEEDSANAKKEAKKEEKEHRSDENEGEKHSKIGALKDKTMGSVKEKVGELTNNPELELKGKAQNLHGKNEAAFAQAQKEGKNEPDQYAVGNPNTINA